jgi:hypothetical protein
MADESVGALADRRRAFDEIEEPEYEQPTQHEKHQEDDPECCERRPEGSPVAALKLLTLGLFHQQPSLMHLLIDGHRPRLKPERLRKGAGGLSFTPVKRIYETSKASLLLETVEAYDSPEIWLTFFDYDRNERLRSSWGPDALSQPDFEVRRQALTKLTHEGFPAAEAERLAERIAADVRLDE